MNHANTWTEAVVTNRREMRPVPTEIQPQLQTLSGIRSVVFDVYGTLVISGSGDVGSVDESDRGAYIADAIEAAGITLSTDEVPTIEELHGVIRNSNTGRTSPECPHPEVDIVDIWRKTLSMRGVSSGNGDVEAMVRLAAEYESRANPTWPMDGATPLISHLSAAGLPMGIVSNAQIFTPRLVCQLTGATLADSGFDLDLCVFSNRFAQSKPGPRLFDVLRDGLKRRGIEPHEAIYVGNDMLNDVWAASQAGLKTAWFAGDRRSLRRREDDPRCRSLRPDLVVTELMQLPACLAI